MLLKKLALVGTGVALAAALDVTAEAQELRMPEARQGYYLGGGLRSGITTAEADVGGFGALTHLGASFRFGQMATPWLGLGLALGGGAEGNDDWTLGYGFLQTEGQLKPFDFDLAVRLAAGVGGGGVSRVDESESSDDDPDLMFGPMFTAGLSYDWFPGYDASRYESGGFAFSFFAEARFFPGGDVNAGGGFIGVELTWWTGLDKRKLDLPIEEAFD